MKKLWICCLFLSGVPAAFSQNPRAVFLEVSGRVEIKEAGSSEWQKAAPGAGINGNTVISTGFRSRALVSLGSSRLDIHPLTALTLEELVQRGNTEETALYLRTGRIRATVNRPAGLSADFTVRSPVISASVRGTSFEFDGVNLRVESGLVLLARPAGQKVYVAGGQRSYVDANNQNRIMPPFEAEAALLRPLIPELAGGGSGAATPEISQDTSTDMYIGWP
jgi:ferric-dicitrate binding protein FerR (iron transport regulator)